jgi:hypothetical protein
MAIYKRLSQAIEEAETSDGIDSDVVFDKAMAIIQGQGQTDERISG